MRRTADEAWRAGVALELVAFLALLVSFAHRQLSMHPRLPLILRLSKQAHLQGKIKVCPRAVGGQNFRRLAAERERQAASVPE